jgi:poly(A)-specific ribonuclease
MFPKTQLSDAKNCRLGIDRMFSCQASGIEFLSDNNFDFNTWIKHGVSYLNNEDEASLRIKINNSISAAAAANTVLIIDEENKTLVADSLQLLQNWLQNSTAKTIMINTSTSIHKRLVYQESKKKFNGFLGTENKSKGIIFTRLTVEEKKALLSKEPSEVKFDELDEYIGVRKLTDMISKHDIPIILHNGFLDSMYLMHHLDNPVPALFEDFKKELNQKYKLYFFVDFTVYTIRNT